MLNKFYDQVDRVSAKYQLHTLLLPILKDYCTFIYDDCFFKDVCDL